MNIANILQNISFGKTTEQFVRSLGDIINGSSDKGDRPQYEDLVQPPQVQDDILGRDRFYIIEDIKLYLSNTASLKKLIQNKDVIRVMSWNVSLWKQVVRPDGKINKMHMLFTIGEISPTILCLQEDSELGIEEGDSIIKGIQNYERIGQCKANANNFNSIYIRKDHGLTFSVINSGAHNIQQNNNKHCGVFVNIILKGRVLFSLANVQLDKNIIDSSGLANMRNTIKIINDAGSKNKIVLGDMNSYKESDYPGNLLAKLKELVELQWILDSIEKGDDQRSIYVQMINSQESKGYIGKMFSVVAYLEENSWVDSFEKYFESNHIEKENRTIPLNTVISGGRSDFIFVNKDFDLPILGCYKILAAAPKHSPIVMDLYCPA